MGRVKTKDEIAEIFLKLVKARSAEQKIFAISYHDIAMLTDYSPSTVLTYLRIVCEEFGYKWSNGRCIVNLEKKEDLEVKDK